jgi:hypothetical protein
VIGLPSPVRFFIYDRAMVDVAGLDVLLADYFWLEVVPLTRRVRCFLAWRR